MRSLGGYVIGVGSLVNRSATANPFDPLPYVALVEADLPTWERSECPLCKRDRPIVKPGSRPVK